MIFNGTMIYINSETKPNLRVFVNHMTSKSLPCLTLRVCLVSLTYTRTPSLDTNTDLDFHFIFLLLANLSSQLSCFAIYTIILGCIALLFFSSLASIVYQFSGENRTFFFDRCKKEADMRGGNRDTRVMNNTLETINAAATAIALADNRVTQPTVQTKRWGSCFSISACFGYSKNRKRIEPSPRGADAAAPAAVANSTQAPNITLPFAAPPSSPASFLQSEPPSIAQSPTGMFSLTSVSASMYSPGGPASIFAIGPYAHETQLVSPPVFSTFTTEPSTAPFTPPPESVHLTTPSSPEVPFAQLLDPNLRNGETYQRFQVSHYDFHSYQLHPGSPVGQLISPRSGISASGTSSPLPDCEFTAGGSHILGFQAGDSPKLNFDKLSANENQRSHQGSGSLTPDAVNSTTPGSFLPNHWVSEIRLRLPPYNNRQNGNVINHRVSIELSTQEVLRCVEKKPVALTRDNDEAKAEKEENLRENRDDDKSLVAKSCDEAPQQTTMDGDEEMVHQKQQSKEFKFDNADGGDSHRPNIVADWWANEKLVGKEEGPSKNWSFFPMIQPGLS